VPVAVALDVLLQLCDALECAHERGVVHRDLKPDNVFLVPRRGRDHFVKLVDFGIAKLRDATASPAGRTASGLIVGTPEYMAPEQCDDRTVDARTDVYSLGVMAFELLAGRLPFQGRTVTQLLLAHLQQRPPSLLELVPGLDPELDRVVARALEKAPEARHASMAAMAAALRPVAARLASGAVAPAPGAPAPAAAPAARPEVAVELRVPGATPRQLVADDVTRAGLFVHADRDLPPLFTRVSLVVTHEVLRAPLELAAEVVRHVRPAEATQWKMRPGFAVQLVDMTPERRAAVADLAEASRPVERPTTAPAAAPPDGAAILAELEARAPGSHYDLLGLPTDAEFVEVRQAARRLREELEAVRAVPRAPDHHPRATALLARLDLAQQTLNSPAERLTYDAERGNFMGVGRCVSAGVPSAVLQQRRRTLLARHPERAEAAKRHAVRAQVASRLGNVEGAVAAYEDLLRADPLDVESLEAYVALRRRSG
jgi:serine/threonine-protein kinase